MGWLNLSKLFPQYSKRPEVEEIVRWIVLIPLVIGVIVLFKFLLIENLLLGSRKPSFHSTINEEGNSIGHVATENHSACTGRTTLKRSSNRRPTILNAAFVPSYVINEPAICSKATLINESLLAFIYVHSKPSNFDTRAFLRRSWLDRSLQKKLNFTAAFLMGDPANEDVQSKLQYESETFGDIIQANFRDVYENLTLKEISGLHWTSTFCHNTVYVLKSDDDLIVKPWLLAKVLKSHLNVSSKPGFFCRRWDNSPVLREGTKWNMPFSSYPNATYPTFCSGPFRIMTRVSVPLLYQGTREKPTLWLEDVYVTGIVAEHLAIPRHNEPFLLQEVFKHESHFSTNTSNFVVAHAMEFGNQRRIWEDLLRNAKDLILGDTK